MIACCSKDAFKVDSRVVDRQLTYPECSLKDNDTYAEGGSGDDDIDTEGGIEEDGFDKEGGGGEDGSEGGIIHCAGTLLPKSKMTAELGCMA